MNEGLDVSGLRIAYGGNVAVQDASLIAPLGRITALIGPNGAGKTTTFNACSGLLQPTAGSVRLCGVDVSRRSVATRARMGLGRTFQQVQVCGSMTVEENVALGAEIALVGSNPLRQLSSSATQRMVVRRRTSEALEQCGIARMAKTRASVLSTGQRRLLELARVLAGEFRMLLLDEPSSGLDEEETFAFGRILRDVVAERGTGILLVEHDMALVMGICEYIYVLDFGQMIFEGTPGATQNSAKVRAAYLGEDADFEAEGLTVNEI
jgi:ABC-type branched-subunit amino acid transport system ATPase component